MRYPVHVRAESPTMEEILFRRQCFSGAFDDMYHSLTISLEPSRRLRVGHMLWVGSLTKGTGNHEWHLLGFLFSVFDMNEASNGGLGRLA